MGDTRWKEGYRNETHTHQQGGRHVDRAERIEGKTRQVKRTGIKESVIEDHVSVRVSRSERPELSEPLPRHHHQSMRCGHVMIDWIRGRPLLAGGVSGDVSPVDLESIHQSRPT